MSFSVVVSCVILAQLEVKHTLSDCRVATSTTCAVSISW